MNQKGFTLIEVLVYFIILGIISAISIPSFKIISESSFKADARSLVSDIRYTKDLTLNNGEDYKIFFSNDGYEIKSPTSIVKTYKFQRGTKFEKYELNIGSKKVNYMEYTQDGRATASGSLILSDAGGVNKKRISITPVTGRVALLNN